MVFTVTYTFLISSSSTCRRFLELEV